MISNIEDDMRSYFVSGSVSWTLAKPSRLGDLHWDAKPSASALNRCLLVFHQDPQCQGCLCHHRPWLRALFPRNKGSRPALEARHRRVPAQDQDMLPIPTSPCNRPMTSKRGAHVIDDDAESLASPSFDRSIRHSAKMTSPRARPKAPKDCGFKSPPPTISDRAARHERREKVGSDAEMRAPCHAPSAPLIEEDMFCALEKCDEEMLNNFCRACQALHRAVASCPAEASLNALVPPGPWLTPRLLAALAVEEATVRTTAQQQPPPPCGPSTRSSAEPALGLTLSNTTAAGQSTVLTQHPRLDLSRAPSRSNSMAFSHNQSRDSLCLSRSFSRSSLALSSVDSLARPRALETPTSGPDAFEAHKALVKCPAPKRPQTASLLSTRASSGTGPRPMLHF